MDGRLLTGMVLLGLAGLGAARGSRGVVRRGRDVDPDDVWTLQAEQLEERGDGKPTDTTLRQAGALILEGNEVRSRRRGSSKVDLLGTLDGSAWWLPWVNEGQGRRALALHLRAPPSRRLFTIRLFDKDGQERAPEFAPTAKHVLLKPLVIRSESYDRHRYARRSRNPKTGILSDWTWWDDNLVHKVVFELV